MPARLQITLGLMGLCAVFASSFFLFGYQNTWQFFSLNPVTPPFADSCTITYGAESAKQGYDPMICNPADPWERKMNYPRIWQLLYKLGLTKEHTNVFGILLFLSYIGGIVLFIPEKLNMKSQIIILISSFSPAALSGIERGNTDLLLFFIVSLCIVLLCSKKRYHKVASYLVLIFGFLLKLFPIFGLAIYLKEQKKILRAILLFTILFCSSYSVLFYHDLCLIKAATPVTYRGTYGMSTLGLAASEIDRNLGRMINLLSILLLILGSGATVYFIRTRKLHINEIYSNNLDAFRVGSSIFLGTFLLGTNYSYRLIFLIFTLPQLVEWIEADFPVFSLNSKIALTAILFSLWGNLAIQAMNGIFVLKATVFLVIKLSHGLTFCSLILLFVASVPNQLRNISHNYFSIVSLKS
ncbi:MAG TPA: hypothetical protein PKI62_02290 [bacterium]|nr:hypothetical protein [bacterium]